MDHAVERFEVEGSPMAAGIRRTSRVSVIQAMMRLRRILATVKQALDRQAVVALIGPRLVGKATLAFAIAEESDSLYLDLEDRADREKLADLLLVRWLRPFHANLGKRCATSP